MLRISEYIAFAAPKATKVNWDADYDEATFTHELNWDFIEKQIRVSLKKILPSVKTACHEAVYSAFVSWVEASTDWDDLIGELAETAAQFGGTPAKFRAAFKSNKALKQEVARATMRAISEKTLQELPILRWLDEEVVLKVTDPGWDTFWVKFKDYGKHRLLFFTAVMKDAGLSTKISGNTVLGHGPKNYRWKPPEWSNWSNRPEIPMKRILGDWYYYPGRVPQLDKTFAKFGFKRVFEYVRAVRNWLGHGAINKALNGGGKILEVLDEKPKPPQYLYRGIEVGKVPQKGQKVIYSTEHPYTHWSESKSVASKFCSSGGVILKVKSSKLMKHDVFVWPTKSKGAKFANAYKEEKEWGIRLLGKIKVDDWKLC